MNLMALRAIGTLATRIVSCCFLGELYDSNPGSSTCKPLHWKTGVRDCNDV